MLVTSALGTIVPPEIVDSQVEFRQLLEQAGHCATAVARFRRTPVFFRLRVPDLLATDVVLMDRLKHKPGAAARSGGREYSHGDGKPRPASSSLTAPDNLTCQSRFCPICSCNGCGIAFVRLTKAAALSRPISPEQAPRPCFLQLVLSWRAL
jgi:hypothetical protein